MSLTHTHTEIIRDTDPSVLNVNQKKDCLCNAERINSFFPFFSPLNWISYSKVIVPTRNNPCPSLSRFTKPQTYIFTTIRVSMVTDDGAF